MTGVLGQPQNYQDFVGPAVTAAWLNAVDSAAGAVISNGVVYYGLDTGSVNAYNIAPIGLPNPAPTGTLVHLLGGTVNTGPSTLTTPAGTVAVLNQLGNALTGGEMTGEVVLKWTGTAWQIVSSVVTPDKARTGAEIAAGVIPVNYAAYLPGYFERYQTNTTPGTTDVTTGVTNAVAQSRQPGGAPIGGFSVYNTTASIPNLHTAPKFPCTAVIKRSGNSFALFPTAAQTNNLYVSTTGADTNDGLSTGQPFLTRNAVFTALVNYGPILGGVWISNLAAGTYGGANASATLPAGLQSYNFIQEVGPSGALPFQPTAIIDGTSSTNGNWGTICNGNNTLMQSNLLFQNWTNGNAGVQWGATVAQEYSEVFWSNVYTNNCDNELKVQQGRIYETGGIHLGGFNGSTSISGTTHSFGYQGTVQAPVGIPVTGASGTGTNATVTFGSGSIATTVTAGSAAISATNTLVVNQPVVFSGSFASVTGLVAGTTYYVSATGLSGTQFEVSATTGGAVITPGGSGSATPTVAPVAPIVGSWATIRGINPAGYNSATAVQIISSTSSSITYANTTSSAYVSGGLLSYNHGSAGVGPLYAGKSINGVLIQENSTGHFDFGTLQNSGVGADLICSCRINANNSNLIDCSTAGIRLRMQSNWNNNGCVFAGNNTNELKYSYSSEFARQGNFPSIQCQPIDTVAATPLTNSTALTTLKTYSNWLPAAYFTDTTKTIRIRVAGTIKGVAGTKTIQIATSLGTLGTFVIPATFGAAAVNTPFVLEFQLLARAAANSQDYYGWCSVDQFAGNPGGTGVITGSLSLGFAAGGAQTLTISGQLGNLNDTLSVNMVEPGWETG